VQAEQINKRDCDEVMNKKFSSLTSISSSTFDQKSEAHVRVTNIRNNQFVEFDFSLDDPTIFIELVLPFDMYKAFCRKHNAVELTPEQEAQVDLDTLKWRYGEPDASTVQRIKEINKS